MKEEMFDGFFGGSPEFWIGKVVRIDQQKETSQGFSWGWRYKVRIFGIVIILMIRIVIQPWLCLV